MPSLPPGRRHSAISIDGPRDYQARLGQLSDRPKLEATEAFSVLRRIQSQDL